MAGVTNTVFRQLCRAEGADVLTTEFVSAEGVFRRNERTRGYLEFAPAERPLGVQLFGADPDHLARAATAVVEWVAPDFIDLNFGCPANKVVCKNGGSALLREPDLLAAVASAVVRAAHPLPVTAKIRLGWDKSSINAVDNARRLEQAGVRRITVHGRTKAQGYSGQADWEVIGQVATAVNLPVIGNGDIDSAEVALRRWADYPVAGLMIGRAAMNRPWIFAEIRHLARHGSDRAAVSLAARWDFLENHARLETARWEDPVRAVHSMRGRFMAYARGLPAGRELRRRFGQVGTLAELAAVRAWHEEACRQGVAAEPGDDPVGEADPAWG